MLTSKSHLEQNLKTLNEKYDHLTGRLKESELLERRTVEEKVKLQDKLDYTMVQLVRNELFFTLET